MAARREAAAQNEYRQSAMHQDQQPEQVVNKAGNVVKEYDPRAGYLMIDNRGDQRLSSAVGDSSVDLAAKNAAWNRAAAMGVDINSIEGGDQMTQAQLAAEALKQQYSPTRRLQGEALRAYMSGEATPVRSYTPGRGGDSRAGTSLSGDNLEKQFWNDARIRSLDPEEAVKVYHSLFGESSKAAAESRSKRRDQASKFLKEFAASHNSTPSEMVTNFQLDYKKDAKGKIVKDLNGNPIPKVDEQGNQMGFVYVPARDTISSIGGQEFGESQRRKEQYIPVKVKDFQRYKQLYDEWASGVAGEPGAANTGVNGSERAAAARQSAVPMGATIFRSRFENPEMNDRINQLIKEGHTPEEADSLMAVSDPYNYKNKTTQKYFVEPYTNKEIPVANDFSFKPEQMASVVPESVNPVKSSAAIPAGASGASKTSKLTAEQKAELASLEYQNMTGEQQRAAMRKDAFADPSHMVDVSNLASFATNPMNWARGAANAFIAAHNAFGKTANQFDPWYGEYPGKKGGTEMNNYYAMQPGMWFTDRNDDGTANTSIRGAYEQNGGNNRFSQYERYPYVKTSKDDRWFNPKGTVFDANEWRVPAGQAKLSPEEIHDLYGDSQLGDYYYQ